MRTELILWIFFLHYANSQDASHCCEKVIEPPGCNEACKTISLSSNTEEQLHQVSRVASACPKELASFWLCINDSVPVIRNTEAGVWPGRVCCQLTLSPQCQSSCKRAKSKSDLGNSCRPSDEYPFFNCVERQEMSVKCCSGSAKPQCQAACKAIFIQDSNPTSSQEALVQKFCEVPVAQCLHNYTKAAPPRNPSESLPCCDQSESEDCRSNCREALQTMTSEEEIIDKVTVHCGAPNPSHPLWQCFLRSSTNDIRHEYTHGGHIKVTGIDGAKLQCCTKAVTENCRDLCVRTYSRDFGNNINDFHDKCRYHNRELELNMCLEEVDEPCQLGCTGLDYCSNFNYRPTELFRSCTKTADSSAKSALAVWSHGVISLPMMEQIIPVKDIEYCNPEKWKAIACTLEVRPCHRKTHSTRICKRDCVEILEDCLDKPRLLPTMSAESICETLSPQHENEGSCISLNDYLVESPYKEEYREVTNPCNPNPCESNQICQINRKQCKQKGRCLPYVCKPGCPMGEVITHLVPHNSYVRIPTAATRQLNCYRVCKCGHHNMLHKCRDMQCLEESDCLQAGSGRIENHNSRFLLGCNRCACYSGEMVCTWRYCLSGRATSQEISRYTGLPCNCDGVFEPVCGVNGKTYPNSCLARCSSLQENQYVLGACASKNPCDNNPCPLKTECVTRHQTCMSRTTDCKQYECVNTEDNCNGHLHDPVCDTEGNEWKHVCRMLERGKQLAYRGHCLRGCDGLSGTVCGVNGETYPNECAAWADNVPVDYENHCRAVGQLLDVKSAEPRCADIQCPAWPRNQKCVPITPPGACCPQCAGEIRILYSRQQVETASRVSRQGPITVRHVVEILRQHMSVSQCDVFGYLSVEGDLVVLILPVVRHPTPLQIQACMREAEKIGSLIAFKSPTLASHIAISTFLSADVRTAKMPVKGGVSRTVFSPSLFFFVVWTSLLYINSSLR